jgi:hypothetical protein
MKKKKSEIASPMVKKFSHQRHTKEDLGLKFEDLKPMEFLASVWVLNLKIWVWVWKMWVSTGSGFGFRSLGFGSHSCLCFGGLGGLILDLWFWSGIESACCGFAL